MGDMVQLDPGTMGFEARPQGTSAQGGVVIVHEITGLNDNTRRVAQQIADRGYVALAVDLFEGQTPKGMEDGLPLREKVTEDVLRTKIGAGVSYLKARPYCSGQLGVVGFCMGGGMALWSACLFPDDIRACSVFYGRIGNLELLERLQHPVIGNFGAQDAGITTWAGQELWPAMMKLEKSLDMKVYPGAPHGFAREGDEKTYRPEAARDAWDRTFGLFDRELRSKGSS
jgi:carboxymethylenebutenolidase